MAEVDTKCYVLEIKGCPIHYWLSGPAGKPLVVFTHGMRMDHRLFAEQEKFLSKDYRVLLWDVRGHGLSEPMGESISIKGASEDILAILDEILCEKAILVGHSMGGLISQELTFYHPERVIALVILGSMCITWKQPLVNKLVSAASPTMFWLSPEFVLKWMGGYFAGIRPETKKLAGQMCRQVSKTDFLKIWKAVTRCDHYEKDYHIKQPLLLTHGQYDNMVGLGLIKKLAPAWAECEKNSRYEVIPQAGHNACMDNPEFFNNLLMDFFRNLAYSV